MVENHIIGRRPPNEEEIAANLDSLIGNGSRKLSSPEAALLLAENYARVNFKPKDIDTEKALGAVLWREEEDSSIISPFRGFVLEYAMFEIKKYFGLSLEEYLNLNFYEVDIIKMCANKLREEFLKAAEKSKQTTNDIATAGNRALSSLEDLEEEIS